MRSSSPNLPVQPLAIEAEIKIEKIRQAWKRQNPTGTEEDWKLYYESLSFWTDVDQQK